jgi:hypothetical protein
MTAMRSVIGLSIVVVSATALTLRSSLAEDTNAASAGIVDFEFRNAPAFAVIEWVARLSHEPLVVPYDVNFPVTLRTERKLTREEAIQAIDGVLRTNGYQLVKTDESYCRVMKVGETNSVANRSHIDLEIQGDKLVVNGNTIIDRNDLAKTLATLSKPDTEVWIRHSVFGPGAGTGNEAVELLTSLRGLDANKMFLKYVPEGR